MTRSGAGDGIARQAALSTGQVFTNIRPLQQSLKRLRRLQRKLDRQRRANNPGNYLPDGCIKAGVKTWNESRRMLETERLVARLHERVADQRRHAAHHLTSLLVARYGVIGAETLNLKGMLADKRLARHISDVGWGLILAQLQYKTGWSEGSIHLAQIAEIEAKPQGRTGLVIVVTTAQVARGATDLEKRRSRRGSQATATNRTQDPLENQRAA